MTFTKRLDFSGAKRDTKTAIAAAFALVLTASQALALDVTQPALQAPAPSGVTDVACRPPTQVFEANALDATARSLAGFMLDAAAPLNAVMNSAAGKAHATSINASWKKLDERQLNAVKLFGKQALATTAGTAPLYYPFSGPDLLYANALFPNASGYLLTGLEPVGSVPDLVKFSPAELNASFADLRKSLNSILSFSFFRTNDMRVDFKKNRLQGVTPVLMTFAVKSGFAVQGARFFVLNPDGSKCLTDAAKLSGVKAPQIAGVELSLLRAGESVARQLTYLSADIGNSGLVKTPQYEKLVSGYGHRVTFLKSASFLMHKEYFSSIRDLILKTSSAVIQDDSGVPYRAFDKAQWQPVFYGTYVKPIPLFANHDQKDLHKAFKELGSFPLSFGIGYRYSKNDSSMLVFIKR